MPRRDSRAVEGLRRPRGFSSLRLRLRDLSARLRPGGERRRPREEEREEDRERRRDRRDSRRREEEEEEAVVVVCSFEGRGDRLRGRTGLCFFAREELDLEMACEERLLVDAADVA